MNILTQHEQITKWLVAIDATTDLTGQPDNVYPFAGGIDPREGPGAGDQWAIVMNETQIAWAAEYGTACMIYVSALQTQREHAERCPQDSIPYDGVAPEVEDDDPSRPLKGGEAHYPKGYGSPDVGLSEATISPPGTGRAW